MKIIKNVIAVVLFTITLTGAFAQSGETKNLLINKWVIDKEAMKPTIGIMLVTNPQFATLDAAGKEAYINTILDQISGLRLELASDGSSKGVDTEGSTTGKWKLSTDGKELTNKSEGKPERKFTVVAVSKTKLHLIGEGNREIFLKAEN